MSNRRVPTPVGQIEVERAIAEIRAGRPVVLLHGSERFVVSAVDTLERAGAEELELAAKGSACLVLSAPRLRRLGLDRSESGCVALPRIDVDRVQHLSYEADARIDAPVAGLTPLHVGALELMRLAMVLPAAIILTSAEAEALLPHLLSVSLMNLNAYRVGRRAALRIVSRAQVPLEGATNTEFVVFRGGEGLRDQVAVIIGRPDLSQPVRVRLHSACLTGDLFGSLKCDCGDQLRHTVGEMAATGGGILLYIDQEGRGNGLSTKIRAYELQARGYDTFEADEILGHGQDQRGFDFAADMLAQLGVRSVRVMTNNPSKIAALKDAGLDVVSDHRIVGRRTDHNVRYIAAKRDRAGHYFEHDF
ncbi:GTP cyclohydrolase II RibA [Methylocystis heyeri]|uniref:GTP cyclohydrolase II RibA n=1 Tax=Methylocystis heyeri TaxID=391905 RepID=UPI001133F601|nr:GTP cyclohydrolase II RibA [Methylocystis heyeri]